MRRPYFSDRKLLRSVVSIAREICSFQPVTVLLRKRSASIIRQCRLISVLFEEIDRIPVTIFPPCAALCFEELYIVLQGIKILQEEVSRRSNTGLMIRIPYYSNSLNQLTAELSTPLDIFPSGELDLSEDLEELLNLIRKRCSEKTADATDDELRAAVLQLLGDIKREIVPDRAKLSAIFERLDLIDSARCSVELEKLEDEIQSNGNDEDESKADVIAVIELVRYGKCVLYGASTPRVTVGRRLKIMAADLDFPSDFRCPISLELMRDPVVVSTGQTYDRSSISPWIESGHATCPKTGQALAHTRLIPNLALKKLMAKWCRVQGVSFESTTGDNDGPNDGSVLLYKNKTAFEAVRMTVSFLVKELTASQTPETVNRLVHELRVLAKTDSDSRACIGEAGALSLLVKSLGSDNPSLQVNAITTIRVVSILEANKTRIMERGGVLNGVVEVLRSGATWEAKGNAAAIVFSLTGVHAYRKKLGKKTHVVKALVDLGRNGDGSPRRNAMGAILNLAGDREGVGKLVEGGVVDMVREVMDSMEEEATEILEAVVKRGGLVARNMVERLAGVLREGSDRSRESAVATLVSMCRKGGSEMVMELASITGIERVIWEVMRMGTRRAKRKAAALLRILRSWADGLIRVGEHNNTQQHNTLNMTSTRIALMPLQL